MRPVAENLLFWSCRKSGIPSICAQHGNVSAKQGGFILLTVVVAITLIAAIALALSYQGASETSIAAGELERDQLRYVSEAGMAHAKLLLAGNTSCTGYTDIPDTDFGGGSYSVEFKTTSGSPVRIRSIGEQQDGAKYRLEVDNVHAYQAPNTITLQLDATTGKDVHVDSFYDTSNYGGMADVTVRSNPGWMQRPLLEFDLSAIPSGVKIVSAKLELRLDVVSTPGVIGAHRMTRSWEEGTRLGTANADGATWLAYNGANPWTQAGGDLAPAPYAIATVDSVKVGQWVSWEIADLVQEWASGQSPNYGLALVGDGTVDNAKFESSENPDPTVAPKLTIVYACECGATTDLAVTLEPGSAAADTYIADGSAESTNFGTEDRIRISNKTNGNDRALLHFDLGGIHPSATVTSATLELDLQGIGSGGTASVDVHRILTPWDESLATWNEASTGAPWATPGGDYDPVVEATAGIDAAQPGATTWDVTTLVANWANGTYDNHGLMLLGSDGVNHADFTSGDSTAANAHPKLHVTLGCPCAGACYSDTTAPGSGKNVLLVVGDPSSLTVEQADKQALMQGWGHTVSLIATSDSQAAYDAAAAIVDVVYVPELGSTPMNELDTKADRLATAVITEESRRPLLLGSFAVWPFVDSNAINVTDNSHYITNTLPLGNVVLSTTVQSMWVLQGTLAPDLHVLGTLNGTEPGLAYLEAGELLNDNSPAPARRVKLPWGAYNFDVNLLTDDGLEIMQRAIEWGAGAGVAAPPPGYRDEFRASTCDAAVDYAGSDGMLDWSPWAWVEINESDGSCAGQIQVAADPDIPDPDGVRLRVTSQGVRISRIADLSAFSQPTLSFDYRLVDYPSFDFMRIRVSTDNGMNWTELDKFEGPLDHTEYQSASYDLTAHKDVDTIIQFEFNGVSTTRTSYIDNVHIQEATGGGGGGPCDGTYLDQFEIYAFDNSDGTLDWSTSPWTEVGESDGPTAGDIRIWTDLDSVRIRTRDNDNGGEGLEREADLSGAASVTLSYDYRRNKLDSSSDFTTVEVSANGAAGPWTELARYSGPTNDSAYVTASHDISAFASANTRVRLKTSSSMGGQDEVWFDNVEIACTP